MKYCVTSYSFSKFIKQNGCDYIRICDEAKAMGFDGIEFVNLDGFDSSIDPLTEAVKIKEHCTKIGLEIVSYTVNGNLLAEDIEGEVRRLKGCVDVAEALGAKVMRHDVAYSLKKIPNYSYKDAIADMVPYIREITEYAEKKGIRTCVENHGYIFQAPLRVEELIKAVNHPNYGWLIDLGNFLCADSDPSIAVAIAAPYAVHVHAKDFIYKSGDVPRPEGFFGTAAGNHLRGTIVGHGVVPIAKCLRTIKASGYDSYLSVEFEGMEECLPAIKSGLNFLKTTYESIK